MAIASNTDEALSAILGQFKIPEDNYTFQAMTSGLINDTFLVSNAVRPIYVLQRINHVVFENVSGLMGNFQNALHHLRGSDYTQLDLVPTKEGGSYYERKDEPISYWRLIGFLENTRTYDTAPNEEVAFEAGRIIGKFHVLLQKADPSQYIETIPRFHELELRSDQFFEALGSASSDQLKMAGNAISFAKETFGKLLTMQVNDLPIRVCHNDTKLNNILFSETTQKALCLIDLDTLMCGRFSYDFGDAVRTIANTASEDEEDHSKINFQKPLFKALVMGLASNGAFLSDKEIQSLASGAVLMPFLHGLRALTDYLNNNKYYKVSYENQNLDRSASLFAFTEKALDHLVYMKEVTRENLVSL
ncbi:aminoglycoside phosphotransferase family protein [Aggregatimonas sangjinii]|uniref:Aminoglycoside phosphotransferase family protein n=1 Tax=Aggregatimonas sangjinii TaxID=2583587 RepID=A0A5B7ST04_9FLAO|nr:aminoglycoside phosphotransferase family protein [Aggregatimonas sangjinii]QCX01322.1 aminoglycoside phosphotransferase family protein [Aggregatimonas sangjinii]